jgi:hypothetical protein
MLALGLASVRVASSNVSSARREDRRARKVTGHRSPEANRAAGLAGGQEYWFLARAVPHSDRAPRARLGPGCLSQRRQIPAGTTWLLSVNFEIDGWRANRPGPLADPAGSQRPPVQKEPLRRGRP